MIVVRAEKLGKRYKQYARSSDRLIEWLSAGRLRRHHDAWVLRGASFEVKAGESLAIVGANGAGKSTLLKLIAGLTQPTEGSVAVHGRVAVLQLGLGFHQEFTGRQNAFAAAELLGVRSADVAGLMPEIEAFAEIGSAIDDPVRTYSSGMQVRLAFAIATAVRPEVLIVDEVLAVGDAYFQQKCVARIHRFRDEGTTLLFVSHDPAAIKRLCERSILLDRGLLIREGPSGEVLDYYNALIARMTTAYEIREGAALRSEGGGGTLRSGTGEVVVTRVELLDEQGAACAFPVGARMRVRIEGEAKQDVDEVTVGIAIRDRLGVEAFGTNTHLLGVPRRALARGDAFSAEFALPLNLGVGSYTLTTAVHVGAAHVEGNYDWWDEVLTLQVIPGDEARFVGAAYLPTEVRFATGDAEPIRARGDARSGARCVIEPNNPEIDVDALMAEIREDVMSARSAANAPLSAVDLGANPGAWTGIADQLDVAARHAAIGVEVPPFGRYGGAKRRLARAVARVVLFVTQVISQPQRTYNTSSLVALRLLVERVQALETEIAALRARLAPGPGAARPDRES